VSDNDPFELGPERPPAPADARSPRRPGAPDHPPRKFSRFDEEVERLRTAPEPPHAPLSGVSFMGIFSRTRDIIAANFNDLLDKADDPAKMIRMIILEMEETLVDVRATAARSIADIKEIRRAVARLDELQADWAQKAELALSKDRDDLAKAALIEKQKAGEMAEGLRDELLQMEQVLKSYEIDIGKLQAKLREARGRQNAIAARIESAVARAIAREIMHGSRTQDAFAKFDLLERRADFAEGRAEALGITSLEDEIDQLRASEAIDAELETMKAALKARVQ
jgi:phage shock protein A